MTPKDVLRRYFDVAHDALRWKLDGLSEYDLRRPLTPTGTNLLGVTKHVALVNLGYFGDVFGRPHTIELNDSPGEGEPNADMYASATETSEDILELLRLAQEHAHGTIDALDLDSEGHVPWWGDNNPVTLHQILVHMTTEMHRHLGQIDILREQLDGAVGMRLGAENMGDADADWWAAYSAKLEQIAVEASAKS